MSIWILAILVIVAGALAGWRQGAIRAAIVFGGILVAALLAAPLGGLFHPLLPHLVHSPITAWALAPVCGFILASIPFVVLAQYVHHRAEYHYKYHANELQQALWKRLNIRLGICVGVLNGVIYFVLISFFVFNLGYWTTQAADHAPDFADQPLMTRMADDLGDSLQSSGFSKAASAVGTLPPVFYRLADFYGLLAQNPQLGPRLASYPGLISLWHRQDMQGLVTDANLTNALASGTPLGEIMKLDSVQGLIANKDLTRVVLSAVTNNLDDLTTYLKTGQSAKYGGEPILGHWQFNATVTLAWWRQQQPAKIAPADVAAIRALWTDGYGPMTLLMTGDNQLYVKGVPKFVKQQPNQPAFESQDGQGDWSREGTNYTLHFSVNGEDKFLSATSDGVRLRIKDGSKLLVFDHVD
jgi:phosphate/sulfate permease